MKKIFITLLLLIAIPVVASHIVGGEFELLHLTGNTYQLNLIMYFDEKFGNPGAKEQFADAVIYRKSDNKLMFSQRLFFVSETSVSYTQPACSKGEIITSKRILSAQITLSPETYNDPAGYYISWQRCCRNYSITNIYSDPSGVNQAGQTFYLEFPPVVKNGQPFVDSTPKLFPPLNDYACKGKPYYVDFSGTDDDGDSLVYSMVTPLNSTSSNPIPSPQPRPYPEVKWKPPFSFTNIFQGSPDLKIRSDGILTGTPGALGLFVFAVKVEEFRNKEKIGESRRDFQMLVIECPVAVTPQITGKKLSDANFTFRKNMSVSFSNTVTNEQRCIQVRVADDDSKNEADGFQENITLKVVSLNFKSKDINSVLPAVTTTTLKNGSTKEFSICFPQCPFIKGPYQIGIIAFDDACSLPLMDTLKVTVDTEPPFNTPPYFKTPTATITQNLKEGGQASWPFEIVDDQQDEIVTSLLTNGFILKDAGMKFDIPTGQPKGAVKGTFSWDAYCDIYDFTKRTNFQVTIQADDNDVCNANLPVKRIFNLSVTLPPSDSPIIFTDLVAARTRTINLERRVNEALNFNVYASEATDQNTIDLKLVDNATFVPYGVNFTNVSGKKDISARFLWDVSCPKVDPAKRSNFTFRFIASDNTNKCKFNKADTVDVVVKVMPPVNAKPVLTVSSLNALALNNKIMDVTLGQSIQLNLTGTDADNIPSKDLLKLSLAQASGSVAPVGYEFKEVTGTGKVSQNFIWTPDCSIFKDNVYKNTYAFKFLLTDDHCYTAKADSLTIRLTVKDIDNSTKEFLPPNVITPNGDGCNDYFAMEGFDNEICNGIAFDGQAASANVALPLDNCNGQFQTINIYNRWGSEVFKSTDRKFRWYALNEAAGVYYYTLKYSTKEYKGTISVRN